VKPRAALLQPDPRFLNMAAGFDPAGDVRMMTIGDLHDQMREIEIDSAIPAEIVEQFDKARHAYIYSWFAYDLASLAEQQGYQTLELALREKLSVDERAKADREHWGFGKLLNRAVAHQWLKREDFRDRETGTNLLDFLPMARNQLAHGSRHLYPLGSVIMLQLCADILNALFRNG
jgi:hypothetical protein